MDAADGDDVDRVHGPRAGGAQQADGAEEEDAQGQEEDSRAEAEEDDDALEAVMIGPTEAPA